ncbi:ATP synthase F0 subunit B [Desulfobaculum sp. SPO524]|uniref:ATP synthase F0 subunit B n=1 Tax=Desulfobaculum sp. SPO524 TaxID=3378071 RepID=UPI003853BEE6
MIDLDITFFIQFVNFVVTLVVLNFLLVRPIREIIKKRNDRMAGYLEDAEGFNETAEQKLKNYSAALDEARRNGVDIRSNLREEGVAEEKGIIEAANGKAATALKAERDAVAAEVKSCMDDLKAQVDGMAGKVVAKVLG